ncbi:MAG: helix-turn-helix domain-containing protein [Bacteroidota bacterium]
MRKKNSTNTENEKRLKDTCGLTYAMLLIKGRWTINVMWSIHNGFNRYSLIKKDIEGISEKMLTQRLKDLEETGLIAKQDLKDAASNVTYHLTQAGNAFIPCILTLDEWGNKVRPYTKTLT